VWVDDVSGVSCIKFEVELYSKDLVWRLGVQVLPASLGEVTGLDNASCDDKVDQDGPHARLVLVSVCSHFLS
jgi:hypothetical protein